MIIGGYWGPRKESKVVCAGRISRHLFTLGLRDHRLKTWFPKGYSATVSGPPVLLDAITIESQLEPNKKSTGEEIPELGFRVALWNGDQEFGVSYTCTCGGDTDIGPNSVVVRLPKFEIDKSPIPLSELSGLVEDMAECFDTDLAALTSPDYVREAGGTRVVDVGGWITLRRGVATPVFDSRIQPPEET